MAEIIQLVPRDQFVFMQGRATGSLVWAATHNMYDRIFPDGSPHLTLDDVTKMSPTLKNMVTLESICINVDRLRKLRALMTT